MLDYSKGQIYTIRFHNNTSLIYIGSTIQPLYKRMHKHKCNTNISLYKLIETEYNNDWSVCYIELYELFPCSSKQELEKREGEIIRQFNDDNNYKVINKRIESRTYKEYYEDNKDLYSQKSKIYRENNKEELKQYNKEYREKNKDEIKKLKKIEYNNNKDKYLERAKQYQQINQDKLKEKIFCNCGGYYSFQSKSHHFKTKKHLAYISTTNS
jgi:hypothetical protein